MRRHSRSSAPTYTDQKSPDRPYATSSHENQERGALNAPVHGLPSTAYNDARMASSCKQSDDPDDDEHGLDPDGVLLYSSAHGPASSPYRRAKQRSYPSNSSPSSPNGRKSNRLSFVSLSSFSFSAGRVRVVSGRKPMGWIERHRVLFLGFLTALGFVFLSIYFSIASTLHFYLTTIFLAMPLSLAIDIHAFATRGRSTLTRSRIPWIVFGLIPLLLLPGWDAESTGNSIPTLTGATLTKGPLTGQKLAPLPESIQNRTYYLAANLHNVEHLLPSWTWSMLGVIERVGKENVFLSIYESNSKDQTKRALALFEKKLGSLGIAHKIRMDNQGTRVGREATDERIEYLANVRNVALKPLDEGMRGVRPGKDFDRVVWFNDVFMDPNQVIELLATNNGSWDQVCAFDYANIRVYDIWVTRDVLSRRLKSMWPYFENLSDVQRLRDGLPIEVNACWNGISAFDAKWFIDSSMDSWPRVKRLRAASSTPVSQSDDSLAKIRSKLEVRNGSADPARSSYEGPYDDPPKLPLRFRSSSVCFSSECMLSSFDMHRLVRGLNLPTPTHRNPQNFARPLILMNPRVAVAYEWPVWIMYQHVLRWNVVKPWRFLWQDLVMHRLFGWYSEARKDPRACTIPFAYGWVEPPIRADTDSTSILTLPMASG